MNYVYKIEKRSTEKMRAIRINIGLSTTCYDFSKECYYDGSHRNYCSGPVQPQGEADCCC